MTFDIILNWVSEANIIHHSMFVLFLYFYHSSYSKDQFIVLISKFGIEDFTEYISRSTKDTADP